MMRAIAAFAVLVALSACSEGVDTKVPEAKVNVMARLAQMPADADAFPLAKPFPNTEYLVATSPSTVMWLFKQNGDDACQFVATITDDGPNASRVTTELRDVSNGKESYLCKAVGIAGEESVAATLARRPADVAAVRGQISQLLVTDYGAVVDSVSNRMDEMAPPRDDNCENGTDEQRRGCLQLKKNFEERRKNAPPLPPGTFTN